MALLILPVVLVVLAASALALYSPDDSQPVFDPAAVVVPSVHDLSPIAGEASRQWRQDAHLVSLSLLLRPDLDVSFGYDSASNPEESLIVYFDDPLHDTQPALDEVRTANRQVVMSSIAPAAAAAVDSPEAYTIALDAGGRSFALAHPEARYWVASLQYINDELVAWRVWFSNAEFGNVSFEVVIDPDSGEILDVEERP